MSIVHRVVSPCATWLIPLLLTLHVGGREWRKFPNETSKQFYIPLKSNFLCCLPTDQHNTHAQCSTKKILIHLRMADGEWAAHTGGALMLSDNRDQSHQFWKRFLIHVRLANLVSKKERIGSVCPCHRHCGRWRPYESTWNAEQNSTNFPNFFPFIFGLDISAIIISIIDAFFLLYFMEKLNGKVWTKNWMEKKTRKIFPSIQTAHAWPLQAILAEIHLSDTENFLRQIQFAFRLQWKLTRIIRLCRCVNMLVAGCPPFSRGVVAHYICAPQRFSGQMERNGFMWWAITCACCHLLLAT